MLDGLKLLKRSDVILAIFVIAITAMLLVPLPTPLLDLLLVINLSFAFLLLLTALYIPNALALLEFPSLLLLTTLFRLGLNVASTRLILSQGDAGAVIRTFGTLLIGSEIIVGVIIFAIITIVNFIVIAKGSSRVSEVAARFALDALPGKQMAIDADLRAGLITAEMAQAKREDLRKESQLYGAMDGAMKFVQGDAIAGIFIIFTNVIGGLYLGVVNGNLSFADAIQTYCTLTVGDGLVHQIPALLISICAGIVVTRVSSGENTTLGGDVGAQLFARPGTLLFSGALLVVIGTVSGLPAIPFIAVGLALIGSGFLVKRQARQAALIPVRADYVPQIGGVPQLPHLEDEGADDTILSIVLDEGILFRLYQMSASRYRAWWREFQGDFYNETGLRLPELSVVSDDRLQASSFAIHIGGTSVDSEQMLLDSVLVEVSPESARSLGLEVALEAEHPVTRQRVFWAAQSPGLRRVVEAAGIRTYDFFEYVCLRIGTFFARHPEELLTVAEVHTFLKQIEKKHPGLLSDAFGQEGVNVARITEILQELVRDGVSVRDFRSIIEAIATYCSTNRVSLSGDEDVDVGEILSFVRNARKRQLLSKILSGRKTLKVCTVSEEVGALLAEAPFGNHNGPPAMEAEEFDALRRGISLVVDPMRTKGLPPMAVVCRNELRLKVSLFLRACGSLVHVISYDELDPSISLEPVGIWTK